MKRTLAAFLIGLMVLQLVGIFPISPVKATLPVGAVLLASDNFESGGIGSWIIQRGFNPWYPWGVSGDAFLNGKLRNDPASGYGGGGCIYWNDPNYVVLWDVPRLCEGSGTAVNFQLQFNFLESDSHHFEIWDLSGNILASFYLFNNGGTWNTQIVGYDPNGSQTAINPVVIGTGSYHEITLAVWRDYSGAGAGYVTLQIDSTTVTISGLDNGVGYMDGDTGGFILEDNGGHYALFYLDALKIYKFGAAPTGRAYTGLVDNGFEDNNTLGMWWSTLGAPDITLTQHHTGTLSVKTFYSEVISQGYNKRLNVDNLTDASLWRKVTATYGSAATYYTFYLSSSDFSSYENAAYLEPLSGTYDWTLYNLTTTLKADHPGHWIAAFEISRMSDNPLDIFIDDVNILGSPAPTPPAPTYDLAILDIDLLDGEADGRWVFVSPRQYTFFIDYTNGTAYTFELSFTTADNRVYAWSYNATDGEVINTAPNDGVSGAYISTNGTRAIFKLKFNLPVADSLNVTLYGRLTNNVTDTGWVAGHLFNVYNLGGYATISASGWAGRIYDIQTGKTTGDVFEIYAADTRTPWMIDSQTFGTSGSFLPFYYLADPIKELPTWRFLLTDPTNGFFELKADSVDPGIDLFPFSTFYDVFGGPSSLHIVSTAVGDYIPRADTAFRRKITTEIVNATYWILAADLTSYAKIRLAQNNLYTVGGWEASTLEIKGDVLAYRASNSSAVNLCNVTANEWLRVVQCVDVPNQLQRIEINQANGVDLADTGWVGVYQNVTYLDYFVFIAQDSGDPSAATDVYLDELTIHSDFDQDYGGLVKASMIYNKLTQWRQDFDFSIEEGREYTKAAYANFGFIELGLDYMINGQWVTNALWARVNVTDSNIQNKNNWVKYTVSWYQDDVLLRNDTLYGLFYGYSGADVGDSRKDATGLHWATWFNRANASTVAGGRVNMEFYGMSDKAAWWSIFSADWKPMLSDVDESTCYIRIVDTLGNPCTVKDVSLVRCWERIYRTDDSTFHYSIQNIREQNFQLAGITMEGIDTPPITKTQTPTMPGGFLSSALAAIFKNIIGRLGDGLLWGGLMVWSSFAGFIDVFASYFGAQGWFEYVLASVKLGMAAVATASGYVITINLWIWGLLMWGFGWFTSIIFWISLWLTMLNNAWAMATGTYYGTTDLVASFQLAQFALLLLVCLPLIIVDRMSSRGVFPVIDEIKTVVGAGQWAFDYLGGLIDGFVDLVFKLIEAIPVIE